MSTELLASKVRIPPLRPSLVARPRLVGLLNDGLRSGRTLTLISAPPGFGKTTLPVDWLRSFDSSVEIDAGQGGPGQGNTVLRVQADQSEIVGLVRSLHGLGIMILQVRIVSEGD